MNKARKEHDFMVVDLTENVLVDTPISSANHAALRAGFAGYPANPRWNAAKYCAWKTGRQLREALARGEMVVRSKDSMLVKATEQEENTEDPVPSRRFGFPIRVKQVANSYQLA